MAKMKPRTLRLLRVEDDPNALVGELHVEDLGKVEEWGPFVDDLARLGIVRARKDGDVEHSEVQDTVDLLAIDFRFWKDESTPMGAGGEKSESWRVPSAYPDTGWSQHLSAPSTGVLIGATLPGIVAHADLPLQTTLYTGAYTDVVSDVATVQLLAPMLAIAGWEFPPDALPFKATRTLLGALPVSCESAVPKGMPRYRNQLLQAFGIPTEGPRTREYLEQRLFARPDDLVALITALDAVGEHGDAAALDKVLQKDGLRFYDRDGYEDCLDLRSLFLDHLAVPHPDRAFGMLPPDTIRAERPDDGVDAGVVRDFIQQILDHAKDGFETAGELVHYNSAHLAPDTVKPVTDLTYGARFVALVFAVAEEAFAQQLQFEEDLDRAWDPYLDRVADDPDVPTLREQLRSLAEILKDLPESVPPDQVPADGLWPLSHQDGASIMKGIKSLLQIDRSSATRQVLVEIYDVRRPEEEAGEVDETGQPPHRRRAISTLLRRLVEAGAIDVTETGAERRYDVRSVRVASLELRSPQLSKVNIAHRLGFWPQDDQIYNQIRRIPENCGYKRAQANALIDRLAELRLPPWMAEGVAWYLRRYHPEVNRQDWPSFQY